MIEPNNGQSLSPKDNRLLAPKGSQPRYTAETVLRTRPKIYRQIVRLLSEGVSADQICKLCHVTHVNYGANGIYQHLVASLGCG
jgi:hypothetical protein